MDGWMDGWMDDVQFYVSFNLISVISGCCEGDNERVCEMEPRLRLKDFHLRGVRDRWINRLAFGAHILSLQISGV